MKYCPCCKDDLELRRLDGVERQVCCNSECDFVVWDNPVPVVAGLVTYQDKLLLARNSAWPEGMFSLITGYLERHESPQAAIEREVKEETGLDVTQVDFIGHYPFVAKNQIIMAFATKAQGELCLNDEISEIELINPADIRHKDFGKLVLTAQIIHEWLQVFESG